MDLIHPRTASDVTEALGEASSSGRRVLIVGGRRHLDKGNPAEVDAELWTTQLDQLVAYEAAEMLVVVQAGMRCGALAETLSERGQEWPADAPADATVGGVIASSSSSPRRLRVGAIRDTVVEMELVTGDGRIVKSGARTVKNVTGYDLHRLMTGSLGTLGVITQVALKVRPLPERSATVVAPRAGIAEADAIVAGVPLVAGVVATAEGVEVRLEGWDGEVEESSGALSDIVPGSSPATDDERFPRSPWWTWPPGGTVVEASVVPSALARIIAGSHTHAALAGVGLVWIAATTDEELDAVRARVADAGGVAPAVMGPGGLGDAPPPAVDVHRRLRASFDPAGILAPGRGWVR
ncbi:MAG: FAD-binding oxidoreductase [Actinomycetota bacterium]